MGGGGAMFSDFTVFEGLIKREPRTGDPPGIIWTRPWSGVRFIWLFLLVVLIFVFYLPLQSKELAACVILVCRGGLRFWFSIGYRPKQWCVEVKFGYINLKIKLRHQPEHRKINRMSHVPSKDSDKPTHLPSLISLWCPLQESLVLN